MSKFWGLVGVILIAGIIGLMAAANTEEINFTDLETECREDRTEEIQVTVDDNSLVYSGHFPVQSTDADMRYNYDRSGDRITLNVKAINDAKPQNFERDCYATGIYQASTVEYDGRYTVVTKHNGEQVDKRIIDFR
ncbi:MAG: hypothetical protein V5A72_00530 [Candidatus Nanohaloarchaea archaeon]